MQYDFIWAFTRIFFTSNYCLSKWVRLTWIRHFIIFQVRAKGNWLSCCVISLRCVEALLGADSFPCSQIAPLADCYFCKIRGCNSPVWWGYVRWQFCSGGVWPNDWPRAGLCGVHDLMMPAAVRRAGHHVCHSMRRPRPWQLPESLRHLWPHRLPG